MATNVVEIGIPIKQHIIKGILHPARRAHVGTLLVSGTPGNLQGPFDLFDELALYLQAAGIHALQLAYRQPESVTACIYDILGGLDALRSWGMERAVLILWPPAEFNRAAQPGDNNSARTGGMPHPSVPQVAPGQMMTKMVTTIAGMAEVVAGVATITNRIPASARSRRKGRPDLHLLSNSQHTTLAVSLRRPVRGVTMDGAIPRHAQAAFDEESEQGDGRGILIERLYSWCGAILLNKHAVSMPVQPSIQLPALTPALTPTPTPAPVQEQDTRDTDPQAHSVKFKSLAKISSLHEAQHWLDRQWQEIFAAFEGRCPARAMTAYDALSASVSHFLRTIPMLGTAWECQAVPGHIWMAGRARNGSTPALKCSTSLLKWLVPFLRATSPCIALSGGKPDLSFQLSNRRRRSALAPALIPAQPVEMPVC
jgi:hypothetical protein